MSYEVRELEHEDFPHLLHQMEDPPEKLFVSGKLPGPENKFLCVVGSRKYSPYGKDVCEHLISGLSGYNIVIVSGLAIGMDSIAHKAAIENNLLTVAIPGSGLHPSVIYPRTNLPLANNILNNNGALLSEFEEKFKPTLYSFPRRNRIMAGMCEATLIIEAEEKSGTLITSRLAMEYNREVLVVPGNIFSENSLGSNALIRDGATPIFTSRDILTALNIHTEEKQIFSFSNLNPNEKVIIDFLKEPRTKEEILELSNISISELNILISSMEIRGLIRESLGKLIRRQ